MIGLTIDQWWNLTPREAKVYFAAHKEKTDQQFKLIDTTNFILGKYILLAFNAPKKYPDQPVSQELDENDDTEPMDNTDRAHLDALFGAFAKKADKLPSADEKPQETAKNEATAQNNKAKEPGLCQT